MRLAILGPLAVESGGHPAVVGGTVRRRLLGILALGRNKTIAAERMVELLWGDEAPETAINTIQVHVAGLRRALASAGDLSGFERIQTDGRGYRLVARPGEVDADAFDAGVANARRWAGLDRRRAIDLLEGALGLWRGNVLADVALPADLLSDVAGLEARRDAAIDLRLRLRLSAGDPRAELPDLEALVAADPVNEAWVGLLMVALYRAGRQAEALAAFKAVRRRLLDDLGLDPSPELRRLELAILRQGPELETDEALGIVPETTAPQSSAGHDDRLPAELTTFVGREAELSEIARLFERGARLVTIVGIGGVGKSRLALRAGRARDPFVRDGAAWVDLVAATSAEHVAEAVATAVGIREELESPFVDTLPAALRDRELLLVLDNCEPVTAIVGRVVESLLRAVPGVSVLATSREPLGLAAEHILPLGGLALPITEDADPASIRASDAVTLLMDRGRSAAPRREVADSELADVLAVARHLEGLPLAIEMAAAGLRSASPAEIADRLAGPGATLGLAGSTSLDRHRTLRTTFDSSVGRLGGEEHAVFRRLAAFAAPAPADAITAVCGRAVDDVAAVLSSLVERSLVVPVATGRTTRYGLLVPVREYAEELLAASGERDDVLSRHLAWVTDVARFEYERRIPDEAGAIRALTALLGDLRSAFDRSLGATRGIQPGPGLRAAGQELAGLIGWFWPNTGRLAEGRLLGQRALPGAVGPARARILRSLGYIATYSGEPALAVELLRECVALWRHLDEPLDHALAFSALGWAHLWSGDNELALDAFERGAEQADRIRDHGIQATMQAVLLSDVAQTLVAMRDLPRARGLGERILREASPGDLRILHFGNHFLGDCALFEHDPVTAAVMYARSLELAVTLDDPVEVCVELEGLAMAHAGLGRHAEALRLYDATEAWLNRMGVRIQIPFWRELLDEWIGLARASLGSPGEPDGTPLGAAAAVALARSLTLTAPEPAGVAQWEKYPSTFSVPTPPGPGS